VIATVRRFNRAPMHSDIYNALLGGKIKLEQEEKVAILALHIALQEKARFGTPGPCQTGPWGANTFTLFSANTFTLSSFRMVCLRMAWCFVAMPFCHL